MYANAMPAGTIFNAIIELAPFSPMRLMRFNGEFNEKYIFLVHDADET